VLLQGPPGCGKSTLVRAAATASRATFMPVGATQLHSMYVGEGEAALRDAFRRARLAAPAILFFDDIDAIVGRSGRRVLCLIFLCAARVSRGHGLYHGRLPSCSLWFATLWFWPFRTGRVCQRPRPSVLIPACLPACGAPPACTKHACLPALVPHAGKRVEGERAEGGTSRLLTSFLTEMDGLELAQGLLVLAATNRPGAIDAALLRRGRAAWARRAAGRDAPSRRGALAGRLGPRQLCPPAGPRAAPPTGSPTAGRPCKSMASTHLPARLARLAAPPTYPHSPLPAPPSFHPARRPGRFDVILHVPPPDEPGRLDTLRVHCRSMRLAPDADLPGVAARTAHYTGAELAGVCREAAMAALREDFEHATHVAGRHFDYALAQVQRSGVGLRGGSELGVRGGLGVGVRGGSGVGVRGGSGGGVRGGSGVGVRGGSGLGVRGGSGVGRFDCLGTLTMRPHGRGPACRAFHV
jgi:hypothetical protein